MNQQISAYQYLKATLIIKKQLLKEDLISLGQVPMLNQNSPKYLFVGNGKVSRHFQYYFTLLKIPFLVWTRNSTKSFEYLSQAAEKILVLIKDDEIENFILRNKTAFNKNKTYIHFSGTITTSIAESVHPLMTFGNELYNSDIYTSITFITEKGRKKFQKLFPELPNQSFEIEPEQKQLYHAFCVMSGNFTTILWQSFFDYLDSLNIPHEVSFNYCQKIFENLIHSDDPLSGPFKRKDKQTINKNLKALEGHPMENIYKSFVEYYNKIKEIKS